jgi:hypothetical protein
MVKLLLWFLLLACCWPLAIGFLVLLPLIWLILLPFKLAGLAIHLVFTLFTLPLKVLKVVF